jgi:catechol 2,3-dioxygenase-like lactoylglutathione lyase family enzyme
MLISIDHIVITASNLNKTIDFYTTVLGMQLKKELVEEDNSLRYSLHFGVQKINLHAKNNIFKPHAKFIKPGTLDICFISKKNILYWINKLNNMNIKIKEGPVERSGAKSKLSSIYFNDPDGNLIEISNIINKND